MSAVIAFHAFPQFLPGGFLGVDVFFVISGFLIAGIILRERDAGTFSLAGFYRRRIRRIFPALIVVLSACLGVGMVALFDTELLQVSRHALAGTLGLANFSLLDDTGYFSLDAATNPLVHLWSLGVEEQFYLALPPLVLIFGRDRRHLLVALLTVFLASLWLCIDPFGQSDPTRTFYLPQYRAWELMAGVLLALARRGNALSRHVIAHVASILGLGLLVFALLHFDDKSPQWQANGMAVAGAVLLIAVGGRAVINRYGLSCRPLVFVGLISYPLYLWHWPILVFGRLLLPGHGVRVSLLLITGAVVLAYLTWRFVEKPLRSGRYPARPVLTLMAAMLCVAALAGFIYSKDGRVGWASQPSPLVFKAEINNAACEKRWWGTEAHDANLLTLCSDSSPEASPTVALIGDSHAHHLYEGMKEYYARKGQGVLDLAMSGCALSLEPPLPDACARAYEQIFTKIAGIKSIHTVILGEYVSYMVSDNRPNWVAITRKRLTELTGRGLKVVLMLDVPHIDLNPRVYCHPRTPWHFSRQIVKRCTIPRQTYLWRVQDYRTKAAEAVKGIDGVTLFDFAETLCDKDTCHAVIDGQVLYLDENHLNYYGSVYVSRFYNWD